MKLGLLLFSAKPIDFATVAEAAETSGFEPLWIAEHLTHEKRAKTREIPVVVLDEIPDR